jgi:hypothetical protein
MFDIDNESGNNKCEKGKSQKISLHSKVSEYIEGCLVDAGIDTDLVVSNDLQKMDGMVFSQKSWRG